MHIQKVKIENFKCFKGAFELGLNNDLNILVGDNEAGKSSILEAIHLGLTGILNGKYLRNELTQYVFNSDLVHEYLKSVADGKAIAPPHILIELYLGDEDCADLMGNANSEKRNACGLSYRIQLDEKYLPEYEILVASKQIHSLPIEYYEIVWRPFSRDNHIITSKSVPIKSALIDSTSSKYQNGSDIYISRIIRELLDETEVVNISQAHRRMKDAFIADASVEAINNKIKTASKISDKSIKISVDLASKNAWESSLVTYLDSVPFQNIGKGEQCIIKTKLALAHKKSKEASLILLEEPENHLSHTKLNELIENIKSNCEGKQIIVSTHSSFVANKLGLANLILLKNPLSIRINDLSTGTQQFFEKLSGYDTLRLILCKKAILVEGDSDELIVQKAYLEANKKLPINDRIDVISVGTSFLRFLEIAKHLKQPVTVVCDSDGDIDALKKKYADYVGLDFIKVLYDEEVDKDIVVNSKTTLNGNTLEPKIFKANNLKILNTIFGTAYSVELDMHKFMNNNKTQCALEIFDSEENIVFPKYILEAIKE